MSETPDATGAQNMGREPSHEVLLDALRESVALQSHYATLLNREVGGHRMVFGSVEAWIERLRVCREANEQGGEK